MEKIGSFFRELWDFVLTQAKGIGVMDVVDILLVALLLYYLFKFIRGKRAGRLLVGVLFLIVLQAISRSIGLVSVNYLLQNVYQAGILALIVVFQPELRAMLEQVGNGSNIIKKGKRARGKLETIIDEICTACVEMSREKTGALIAIERYSRLTDYANPKGTLLDADITSYLIRNIFFKNSPLHDGALIIRLPRLYAAGCMLPLSTNEEIYETYGTRHRAAIGLTEETDAIVLVVSEETGGISLAYRGSLYTGCNAASLKAAIIKLLFGEKKPRAKGGKRKKENRTPGALPEAPEASGQAAQSAGKPSMTSPLEMPDSPRPAGKSAAAARAPKMSAKDLPPGPRQPRGPR